ncbi:MULTISPECIES: D-glutamate cyclase family protein [Pseudomonas]|uniref:D-glutamate cyclase family protein n=1 Tax=Pseudomonas TaxID=286 RepID=UPI0009E6E323
MLIGNPRALGITDLQAPDLGVVPPMAPNQLPALSAYAVTPQQDLPHLPSAYCTPLYPRNRLVLNHRPEAFG